MFHNSKKLFAGPWVGEFGWELFAWQAYLRKIAKIYDHVTVCSRQGREFLYQDFADRFVSFNPPSENVTMWANYGLDEHHISTALAPPFDVEWLDPRVILPRLYESRKGDSSLTILEQFTPPDQDFISFGEKDSQKKYDVILHARNRTDAKAWEEKNWPIENWTKLSSFFKDLRIACVGHPNASLAIPRTEDLRGIPLNELADILASSKLCIGCSDGLLNFAALCKTPRLIWTIRSEAEKNIDRHTVCWNPFNAPAEIIVEDTWRPSAETVINKVEQYFG